MNSKTYFNRLKSENSLYLKQHAENPIHWWPFSPEAIIEAKTLNKPIFLSIGYSSCHWCHVMSRESFENLEVANFLNENYICIKVDREEFPDIDSYYQQAASMFGKNGGWPLSAFLLPDLRPFFVGTYFPLNSSEKMGPGFIDISRELARAFKEEETQVLENATKVFEQISARFNIAERVNFEGHFPAPSAILDATKEMRDNNFGGYGSAPKFPQFAFYEWAVEQMLEGMIDPNHGEFIVKSIENMLMGGMNDHLKGGFHRYSADEKWLVPHFEKMLYDQAGLLKLLTKFSLLYPAPVVYDTIINTLDYLEKEMLSEEGHFFSSQDAESEGVEGLYFTFTKAEFEDALNSADNEEELFGKNLDKLNSWFKISEAGNFEKGLNVITLDVANKEELYQQQNWDLIRKAKNALLNERSNRIPPQTDNKGIASWNFMLISALTDVIQYNQIEFIKRKASTLLSQILEKVYNSFLVPSGEGMRLRHVTTMMHSHPYLEDFVTFSESHLRMYEISGNPIFKQNFKDTLDFVTKEFLDNDQMLTRARFVTEHELYPNVGYNFFDTSFKSVVGTYILLMKRAHVLFSDIEYLEQIKNLEDKVAQVILRQNPIAAGEAMRGLTYPKEAYRVLVVPRAWAQNSQFLNFIPYFLPRFVLDYQEENVTDWEIKNANNSEMKGSGLEEFMATLAPSKGEANG